MIKSMTAFGRARLEGEARDITIEMKSVNSRFFDCSVKLPRSLLYLEEKIKSYIQKNSIARGKVDVFVTVENHGSDIGEISVDEAFAARYIAALADLRDKFSLKDDISVMSVARNQEVFKYTKPEEDADEEWRLVSSVLDGAIESHRDMREREGKRAYEDITAKIEHLRAMADEVERISQCDTVGYRDKLEDRLRKILGDNAVTVDENRLLTECAIWADKIAIDEELVRLRSHFGAFYEIAELPEPSGRKLDFLIQELNRETNTIGSKANNAAIARIVVDMKGEIEKIREQIQNIE
ncbi:MAG: YicC family protein [Ruminococcaceae bacterium]|nr:YicC family protein [Oscillospiraceae bacterium]